MSSLHTAAALQERRAIEDKATELATQRREFNEGLTLNTWDIIELLRDPKHTVIPFDHLASLLGVSRQTLYRWREIGQKIPADWTVSAAMQARDEDGNLLFNFGG